MSKLRNVVRMSLGIVVLATLVGSGGAYAYLRPSLPAEGRLAVPGLQAPVEVIRDRWGIPHIYAQNEDDLFFAQGYVEAQDRLWQLEVSRRTARGTLAELLGEDAVASDRLARTLGFAPAAEAEWQALDAESRAPLAAFARGVNAFLSTPGRRLPLEFALQGATLAPWQPQDSLAWARLLAWRLDSDWQAELVRARLVQAVGQVRAAELEPALSHVPAEAAGTSPAASAAATLLEAAGAGWPWMSVGGLEGSAWAVSGALTASGSPIVSSATLLPVQMPSPWYELHLVGGRYDVVGATFPGLPGVAMGRNRWLAWGLSGASSDSMDLYVEHVRPGDPPQVEFEGQWEDVQAREETIHVRGRAEPERLTVYGTRHGPLVSDLAAGAPEQLALAWAGDRQPASLALQLVALDRAADPSGLQAALAGWAAPALVVTYADVQGRAGAAASGAVPDRPAGGGLLPAPGWTGAHEWGALTAAAAAPRELGASPAAVIVTNGSALPGEWPERVADGVGPSPVAARIAELIDSHRPLTLAAAEAVQCDDRGPARPLLSLLLALPPRGWLQERTTPYLRDWDLRYGAESAGAGIYETFYWRLAHETLDDELGPALVDAYLDTCPDQRTAIESLARDPGSPWFDDLRTSEREGRDEIIARSYAGAIEWLGRRFGDLPYEWNWGRVHNVTFVHPLGLSWPLNLLLNRGAMRAGGGPECVAASGTSYTARMAVSGVPYRLVVDLAEGGQMSAMNAAGESGNPVSAHYADMIEPWRDGDYHPLLYWRQAVLEAAADRLTLAPMQ